ncbi:MAG: TAXI family TRAP transporter solute-binding subunit [Rhizomicrobium sp.]
MRLITRRRASGMIASLLPAITSSHAAPLAPPTPNADDKWTIPNKEKVNAGTVTIITAPAGGATSIFGSDMARVLDDDQKQLRVLPVLGKGPVRNVVDILYLKAIDMGAVTAEVPEFYRLQYGIPDIATRLRYIAKLYNNEVHVVARSNVKSIFDLEGKRVVAQTDVGYYSAKVIFTRLGINAIFDNRTDDAAAIQKIADGDVDAYIGSTGKVFGLLRNVKNEDRSLHLVEIPYDKRLQDMYLPTKLTSDDYPNLLPAGESVDTVATSVLLTSFNWPEKTERYNRVARFVDAFFSHIDEFHKPPRHPKWKESSISIVVPGWTRFKAAQDWLDANAVKPTAQAPAQPQADFVRFLDRTGKRDLAPEEKERLYQQFLEWSKK